MIVRLNTSLLWYGKYYGYGDDIDLPDETAERYIATRQAERIECAAVVPQETAAIQKPTFKGNKHGRNTAAGT
jgi:hypothetical protein